MNLALTYLDFTTAMPLSHVHSNLDYCNSLCYDLLKFRTDRLDKFKTLLLVLWLRLENCHITPILKYLHWFTINERIEQNFFLLPTKLISYSCDVDL